MKLLLKIKSAFAKYNPWSAALLFYWTVVVLDYVSSLLSNKIPGLHEANPFARDAASHFVLHKGVICDLTFFAAWAMLSWAIYQVSKHVSVSLAKLASAAPFVYIGLDRLSEAVVTNFLFVFRLYVEDPMPSVTGLFQ